VAEARDQTIEDVAEEAGQEQPLEETLTALECCAEQHGPGEQSRG
jgi:hypothetical protein